MSNTINQEQRTASGPLVIPPEELERQERLERLKRLPMPPINQLILESLRRNCVKPFVPPTKAD